MSEVRRELTLVVEGRRACRSHFTRSRHCPSPQSFAFGVKLGAAGAKFPIRPAASTAIGDIIFELCRQNALATPLSWALKVARTGMLDGTMTVEEAVANGDLKNNDTLILYQTGAEGACSLHL